MTKRVAKPKVTEAKLDVNYVDTRVYRGTVINARKLNTDRSHNSRGEVIPQITPQYFELTFSSHFDRLREGRGFVNLQHARVTERYISSSSRQSTNRVPGEYTRTYFDVYDPQNKPPKWLQNAIYVAEDHIRSSAMLPNLTTKELVKLIRSNGWHKDERRFVGDEPGQVLFRGYTTADDSVLANAILRYWFNLPENSNHISATEAYRRSMRHATLWHKLAGVRSA